MPTTENNPSSAPRCGPPHGALVIVGGGAMRETDILRRFLALAGGPSAPIVVIPTAQEPESDGRMPGVVQGDSFEVIGKSYVGIYDTTHVLKPAGRFYLLMPGDRFDLATRVATRPTRQPTPFPQVIPAPTPAKDPRRRRQRGR